MDKTTLIFAGLACLALNVRAAQSGGDHRPAIVQKVSATNAAVRSSKRVTVQSKERARVADSDKENEFYVLDKGDVEEQFGGKVYKTLSAEPCSTPLAAAQVAERIFIKIYGENIVKERPWRVAEKDGCYIVTGSMPQSGSGVIVLGGVAQLKLQKDDGRVWVFYHGK